MAQRGEYRRDLPQPEELGPGPRRVGRREVSVLDQRRAPCLLWVDPGQYRCARLAGQLADEWVEYVALARLSVGSADGYRRAVGQFCRQVDRVLGPQAPEADLGRAAPDMARVVADWERTLPAGYRPGSVIPAQRAGAIRLLIARRMLDASRPVADLLGRLATGAPGVAPGVTTELVEFSRADKRAITRAAWAQIERTRGRIAAGWQRAVQGSDPREGGWQDPANLLWALGHGVVSAREIHQRLPPPGQWTDALRACGGRDGDLPWQARRRLLRWLAAQLYPTDLELHAFRVLLVAATGHAPEEVAGLGEEDVEFLPHGVRLTFTKSRANRVMPRTFGAAHTDARPEAGSVVGDFTDHPHRQVAQILRALFAVTEAARRAADDPHRRVFIAATVRRDATLRVGYWAPGQRNAFAHWLASAGVQISGSCDTRRMRKSVKVEKVIGSGGRIAAAADDHHVETFRGHYAQGTSLRIISGRVITAAQRHWFSQAVNGPTVLLADADGATAQGAALGALGLSGAQAEQLRTGAMDMGVAHCRDPFDSPFSPGGALCAVAPLRCLECRNAWVLPSHLPQLLLMCDHLERVRRRITPQAFAARWGQSYTNLKALLAQRSEQDIALARDHIAAGQARLELPLFAQVEFDS